MKKFRVLFVVFLVILVSCISVCFIPIGVSKFIPSIEEQVEKDLGIKIHMDRLILRFGPSIKLKSPAVHLMYKNGQKFAQIDSVKFFVPWSSLINKDNFKIKKILAKKVIVKVSSSDKYLEDLSAAIENKDISDIPAFKAKNYSVTYNDVYNAKHYKVLGSDLELSKVVGYNNVKIVSIGEFYINDLKHISYDFSILPNFNYEQNSFNVDITKFFDQIIKLNFNSDLLVNLKLYKDSDKNLLASGTFNLDNISVLDPNNKTPKSFLYLTFLGDRIGVLSNIYSAPDKKVYIEGVINNSKKKSIDLKVKSDKIDMKNLFDKLHLLSDLSKYKDIEDVRGTLEADFTIKGDINKIKSIGFLNISNASFKAKGFFINNINSKIDFSNNAIKIDEAVGYVNKAPITLSGSIDKIIDLKILTNNVELKYLLPSQYGIKKGVLSLSAQLNGSMDKLTHSENLTLDNFSAKKGDNIIEFDSLRLDTNKDKVAYFSNIIFKNTYSEAIKLPSLKLNFDNNKISTPVTNIYMQNSRLKAKLDINDISNKNYNVNFVSSGYINSKDIKSIKSNYTSYPVNFSVIGNKKSQNIDAQVLFEKALILDEPSLLNLESKLEDNILKISDLSISSYSGSFLENEKLNLKGDKKVIITGNVENLNKPIFKNLRIFVPKQFTINLFDTIAQIKGDLFLNGNISKPSIVGQIEAQNIINQYIQLAINNLTIDFNKLQANLNAPQVKLGDSVMGVNSVISTDFSKDILVKNLNIKSKYLNTDTFLMYKDTPIFNFDNLSIESGKLYSEKLHVSIYNNPLLLSAYTSDFSLKNNILRVKNISSELLNGKLAGSLDFNLKDEHFNANISARGVSASPIFDIISTRKDSVSGTMDFDSKIKGNVSSKSSLNGNIKFIVHNGRMGTLGKLEHLLYAQNVVADSMLRTSLSVVTKAITLKDTGLFKYLRGDIELEKGIANVSFLQSQGPLMSLFIKGRYNPDNDYAQLVVLGRLSDEIISGLGAFGDFSLKKLMVMLTGEDDKFSVPTADLENLPQLSMKNTKEFRSVINGFVDRASSVIQFNWISYSQKSYKQKDVPMTDVLVPEFINNLPY